MVGRVSGMEFLGRGGVVEYTEDAVSPDIAHV